MQNCSQQRLHTWLKFKQKLQKACFIAPLFSCSTLFPSCHCSSGAARLCTRTRFSEQLFLVTHQIPRSLFLCCQPPMHLCLVPPSLSPLLKPKLGLNWYQCFQIHAFFFPLLSHSSLIFHEMLRKYFDGVQELGLMSSYELFITAPPEDKP